MKIQNLILMAALVALAAPAAATVKVYDGSADNGITGDAIQYSTTLCPPIQPTIGVIQGFNILTDTGGGTVTLTERAVIATTFVNFGTSALTGIFGPGSFVFVNARSTNSLNTAPPVVSGSTAPTTGSIAWGVLSGFENTGFTFCIASPQTLCTGGAMAPHGSTVPSGAVSSPTFDLGTWSFDAEGDFEATSYITGTYNGGTSNRQQITRGAYVGSSIPALPLLGAGALALGLAVAGSRAMLRKK